MQDCARAPRSALDLPRLAQWHVAGLNFTFALSATSGGARHSIFYRDSHPDGAGKRVLLLLHGFPSSSFDWHKVWTPLVASGWRVVAPDFLGFGFSDKPLRSGTARSSITLHVQADLVEALLASLQLAAGVDVHVMCHDYAVSVVQELLARRRPALASVVFLNGGLLPSAHRPILLQKLSVSPYTAWLIKRLVCPTLFRRNLNHVFGPRTQLTDDEALEYYALLLHNDGYLIVDDLLGYMRERKRHRARWTRVLTHTDVPLLVINGPADPVSGRHLVDALRQLPPPPNERSLDIAVLDNWIGHYPQLEQPDAVLRLASSFWGVELGVRLK